MDEYSVRLRQKTTMLIFIGMSAGLIVDQSDFIEYKQTASQRCFIYFTVLEWVEKSVYFLQKNL